MCIDCHAGYDRRETVAKHALPPQHHGELGETTIRLPLGGVASSDPMKLRSPLVQSFWLLAALAAAAIGLFIWLRLRLL